MEHRPDGRPAVIVIIVITRHESWRAKAPPAASDRARAHRAWFARARDRARQPRKRPPRDGGTPRPGAEAVSAGALSLRRKLRAMPAAFSVSQLARPSRQVWSTMFSSFSPRAKRSRLAATTLQRRSAVASLELELCGVISTLGSSWNGRRDGLRSGSAGVGYCHHTSRAAPPRWPSFKAA